MSFGIKLKNKHVLDYLCASGALNMHGRGYFWDKPFLYSKLLRPEDFFIITKTITYPPVVGNYKFYAPWRCVRLLPNQGVVNAFGLTNKGLRWWINKCYPKINKNYRIIPSIMPHNIEQAKIMASELDKLKNLVALEINLSCANVKHTDENWFLISKVKAIAANTDLPLIIKFGIQNDYLTITQGLKNVIAAVDLINSVPWKLIYPQQESPLSKYNLVGAVSGLPIAEVARDTLSRFKMYFGNTIPIIAGGGIYSYDECLARRVMGANALSFGTAFKRPWVPNKIVQQLKSTTGW